MSKSPFFGNLCSTLLSFFLLSSATDPSSFNVLKNIQFEFLIDNLKRQVLTPSHKNISCKETAISFLILAPNEVLRIVLCISKIMKVN